ncbi:MAG: L-rhamnose mutarotase [Tenacibaculum sp.]
MKEYVFALDLKNDPEKIKAYLKHHQNVWPEVIQTIKNSGVKAMRIYQLENRLFMVIKVKDDFSIETDTVGDPTHPKVQEWENLMWKYQQALPFAKSGEKWMLMNKIFELQ